MNPKRGTSKTLNFLVGSLKTFILGFMVRTYKQLGVNDWFMISACKKKVLEV